MCMGRNKAKVSSTRWRQQTRDVKDKGSLRRKSSIFLGMFHWFDLNENFYFLRLHWAIATAVSFMRFNISS